MTVPELPGAQPYWRRRLWWRRAGLTSVAFWASTAVAFATTVVLARMLGPADYGVVVLALAAGAVLSTFLDISLEDALVYFGSRKLAVAEPGLRALFRFAARLDLLLGAAVTVVLLLAADLIATVFTAGRVDADLVRLGILVAAVATVDGTTGAAGAAVQAYLAWRHAWLRWPHEPQASVAARPLIRFAALSSLSGSVTSASAAVLPLLLARLFDARSVGRFAVAAAPLLFAGLLSGPIRLALMPEQTERLAQSSGRGRRDLGRLVLAAVVASAVTIGAGLLVLPTAVPLLFGRAYEDAVPLALVILVGVLGVNISSAAKLFVLAAGRAGIRAAMAGVELLLVLVLVAAAAQGGQLRAAAAGYAAALLLVAALWCAVALSLRRRSGAATLEPDPAA